MKKLFACALAALLLCSTIPSVYATEIISDESTISTLEYFAYMDLNAADAVTQAAIIEARNEIIHSTSWVADGIYGYVTDAEGNVVEVVPQFYDIFPSDWEIPECSITDYDSADPDVSPFAWQQSFEGEVTLSDAYTEFHTVSTRAFNGLIVERISTVLYNTDGGTYNIRYVNKTTNRECGNSTNLEAGYSFIINAPANTTVSVQVSTSGRRLGWYMVVDTDRVSAN